ncbi:MAG TPA: glycoside hydrolase domain-containing protein [Thermodesulfobacteriota bacterium]|nr:glycoside hydrolase domain-containing protein [Thermodesulfobacteriota bacterium]
MFLWLASVPRGRKVREDLVQIGLLCAIIVCSVSCTKNTVKIQSYILRNRVAVLDRVVMKKALYVSFSFTKSLREHEKVNVHGFLINSDQIIGETSLKALRENSGNLIFDLPYQIPNGPYRIKIDAFTEKGNLVATGFTTVERADLRNYFYPRPPGKKSAVPFEESLAHPELEEVKATPRDQSNGYILFSRSPLEYVFPESRPKKSEILDHLAIRVARNEFEPITFALYPLRKLGTVKVSITDLKSDRGSIAKDKIRVAYVDMVQETLGLPEGKFLNLPALIRPGDRVNIEAGRCQRFWLTIRIDDDVSPGAYKGTITIVPQHGSKTSIPLEVTVVPLSLEGIPSVDYFMMMTYEFAELTMPWSREEKEKIYQSACNVLKDYKEHGMTTLCLHSPFVLVTKEDGTPNLDDILAALRAAKEIGFKGRIVWYMGHLIQTSKPRHPGNITSFDKGIHLPRLKYIVKTVSQYAREQGCPDVIFLPIDEPGDSYQDSQNKRHTITPLLLKTIKESGAKNMLTTCDYKQFKPVDYLCCGEMKKEDIDTAHDGGSVYWLYENDVTTKCLNPAYARYIYGYYTWINHVDGMSSWTFQNTQNAKGLPGRAGVDGGDIYLAYPDPKGPLATLKWEAVREGIDDHKLVYQLVKRLRKLKEKGVNVSKYETFLQEIKQKRGTPDCQIGDDGRWNPIFFRASRDQLISMILDAEAKINL